jgi:hypothetical protein
MLTTLVHRASRQRANNGSRPYEASSSSNAFASFRSRVSKPSVNQLMPPEPDMAKAEAYFERALAIAREQQAKSRELRAAMSVARVWRDQGKRQQARGLLASVYGGPYRRVSLV